MSDSKVISNSEAREKKEENLYRSLLEVPTTFKNGFTWTSVAGAFFCGLLMMPGSIYLSLITGGNVPASWVTLIIFSEISRRALKSLNTQELVVLLYVAGAMSIGGPLAELVFRQYFVTSSAVRDAGLMGQFPSWWAPQPESDAIVDRNFFHADWLVPILILALVTVIVKIKSYTLGYFFFRLTSDVEKLPFPQAPISAQGAMALAESGEKKTTWKWKIFSIGAMIGMIFGVFQTGIPLVTGAVLSKPINLIPLPWFEASALTENFLPATPMGMVVDLGLILIGMVIPFWAMMGTAVALILTVILNPILFKQGVLTRWQPGMDTVSSVFSNQLDFWMSFTVGVSIAVSLISIFQTTRDITRKMREIRKKRAEGAGGVVRKEGIWDVPAGRGDFSPWIALAIYGVCGLVIAFVCYKLVGDMGDKTFQVMLVIFFFIFLYTPFISYINAKVAGIVGLQGQGHHIKIPFVYEGSLILSGYQGLQIWLAPIHPEDYGGQAQHFRVTELTGTNFWSYVKADLLVVPLSFVLSFIFWSFIWHSSAIPSESFPWAEKLWDLKARQQVLHFTATSGSEHSLFLQALHPKIIGGAFVFTLVCFSGLSMIGIPIMAVFGFIRAIGDMPHRFVPEIIGAFIGRYYLQKKFGQKNFLQMAPILVAGYGTGVGLITLIGVAVTLITKAISSSPF